MQLLGEGLVLSPTDLVGYSLCRHLTGLELAAARDGRPRPERDDPEIDLLRRRGLDHERRFLDALRAEGRTVAVVPRLDAADGDLAQAEALTREAMRSGVDVVHQAAFFDGRWSGTADFLLRVNGRSSAFGPFSYEPADAKLARDARPPVVLQLCAYAEQLERLQGTPPEHVHVILGDGTTARFTLRAFAAYFRSNRARLEAALANGVGTTYPDPVPHCQTCRWGEACDARRRRDDHPSLVADLRRDHTARLAAAGIATLEALARMDPGRTVPGIGAPVVARLAAQARLQLRQRVTGQVGYELLPGEAAGRGLAALPPPSSADLFFDMEGDPFAGPAGLEYLFGLVELVDGQPVYRPFWAHDAAGEKRAFEAVIDLIGERRERNPDLHVYHYAAYEPNAFKRLMGVHGTRERELDRILRGQVMVDLHRVVKQGVLVSQESYSLKMLEALYRAPRTTVVAGGMGSVVAYEEWRESGEGERLDEIAAYNRDDCLSLLGLRDWLEARRHERARQAGALPRPAPADPAPPETQEAQEAASDGLASRLTAGLPERAADRTPEEQARWLLAQLVNWHRREAKPEWWAYFNRMRMSEEELFEDSEAIAGLVYEGDAAQGIRSHVHRYRFDPGQEHKIDVGDVPRDPATTKQAGTVVFMDNSRGLVHLKRGVRSPAPHPRSLVPAGPRDTTEQREAIARVAGWVLQHGIDAAGPYRAARDLLLRRPPRLRGHSAPDALVHEGEDAVHAACRIAHDMEGSCLAIQGPPGSGKTWMGARLILSLTSAGRRVGVTATSHKAIANLLAEMCAQAQGAGRRLRVVQKAPEDGRCLHAMVRCVEENDEVEAALRAGAVDVVAGTSWLFARSALEGAVDTLVVEEAGQFSLANAVAMAGAARSLVLLGDPRQLAQPSKAAHPPGAEASALEHLLGEHATMPPGRGLFLPVTRRLHPDVTRFASEAFYDGRLESHPSCAVRWIGGASPLGGAGLRFVAVEHAGNRTASLEEAAVVARIFSELVGRTWTEADGGTRVLGVADVLVVAPYNAQVARLAATLPPGARVGTVDKFQGQEAPAVIYSMAASSAEDAPRGMEFLYSLNRLNVAVSRAQGLAVLVASPGLLRAHCRTVEQMRLASAVCRYVEMADPGPARYSSR
jgi:predicted RecB family nuclease